MSRRLGPVALLSVAILVGTATAAWAAFRSARTNAGNRITAGTVTLSDNATGPMFTVSGLAPGTTVSKCIRITFSGTLPATVRLYGSRSASGLEPYLDVTVTRGTVGGAYPDCTGFTADAVDPYGLGPGVLYDGTLLGYPGDWVSGRVDAVAGGAPETWTPNEVHAYRFDLRVQDAESAPSRSVTQTFVWEARDQ